MWAIFTLYSEFCSLPKKTNDVMASSVQLHVIVNLLWLDKGKKGTEKMTAVCHGSVTWPNGRAFDFGSKGCGFDPHRDQIFCILNFLQFSFLGFCLHLVSQFS